MTTPDDRFQAGLHTIAEVLGPAYVAAVERAAAGVTGPFQTLVTGFVWGDLWSRTELDRRTRSLVTLGMLAAGGHAREFGLHVRGALNNGATREEVREVVIQAAAYAGVPAALEALRAMTATFRELDAEAAR